jgi:3-deoxy-D-manno-octulosonate 8-phosphate phosphatase (KDO 8-P phosphatase)
MLKTIAQFRIRQIGRFWAIVFDVDGVLTDGSFLYSESGKVLKRFGPHDSEGAQILSQRHDIKFISADVRGEEITRRRVADMGFELSIQSASERVEFIKQIKSFGVPVAFIGDSTSDIPALVTADFSMCPSSANNYVKRKVDYVLSTKGGAGVVEEVARLFCSNHYR